MQRAKKSPFDEEACWVQVKFPEGVSLTNLVWHGNFTRRLKLCKFCTRPSPGMFYLPGSMCFRDVAWGNRSKTDLLRRFL